MKKERLCIPVRDQSTENYLSELRLNVLGLRAGITIKSSKLFRDPTVSISVEEMIISNYILCGNH